MNQSLLVTKRDGSTERINLDKIHRVLDWAAEGLNNHYQSRRGPYLPRGARLPVSRRPSGDFPPA